MVALREYEFFLQRYEEVAKRNEQQLEACESAVKSRKIEGGVCARFCVLMWSLNNQRSGGGARTQQ